MTSFWSGWVIVLTSITLVLVTWLLFANRKRTPVDSKTTGHEYDGIEEWDNPLPGWWFAMFLITIIWGIGYLIAYPGMGNFPGVLGWTSTEQHEQEVAVADEKFRAMRDKYLALPIEEIYQDPKARKMGMRIYGNNCSQCHGLDAAGAISDRIGVMVAGTLHQYAPYREILERPASDAVARLFGTDESHEISMAGGIQA